MKTSIQRLFATLTLTIVTLPLWAATYYVSTTGNDANTGTSASPFRTIKKAATLVNAGDVVLISAGTYSEFSITPKSSGTESNYIVFKPNPSYATVIVKHPATSISDLTPIFQLSNKSYIWIEGLQFKDFKYGLASIYISSGNGNVVTNNRFENLGNAEVGEWNGNQMVGILNGARNAVYNNYFNNITGDGINVNSQSSKSNLVCNNTFITFKGKMRSWGGTGLFSRAIDIQDMSDGNNVFAFNYGESVVNHLWLDRDGSNNIILRNYGKGGAGNVFNESRCRSNVIQENIAVGMSSAYMSAFYSGTNWTLYPRWINNVAYNNTDGFVIHKSIENEFRNNISFNNTGNSIEFSRAAKEQGPHIFKNNLWFSTSKANSVLYNHIPATTTTQDITDKNGVLVTLPAYNTTSAGSQISPTAFQTAVGETNGLAANPLFVSTTDFRLQSTSPAKGKGDNGLDLGAFAYYPMTTFGWNSALASSDVAVYFDQAISTATRGTALQLTLRLSKVSTQQVSVDIVPVAGDAVVGQDFLVTQTKVTFQPGETSKTITVNTGNSATYDELVALSLQNATNAMASGRLLHVIRFKAGNAPVVSNPLPTITITSPAIGASFLAGNNITLSANASASSGSISNVQFFNGTTLLNTDNTAPYSFVWNNVAAGSYTIRAVATDNQARTAEATVSIKVSVPQGAYNGIVHPIPGTIQMEEYDLGGNGVAYNDSSAENTGGATFRTDEDVDLENCSDVGGGYNLGYATVGEWVEYTVNVAATGNYKLDLRVACSGDGRTVSLTSDGNTVANNIAIPNTAGWQVWTTTTVNNVPLTAGQHVLRLTIGATSYVNINYMTFSSVITGLEEEEGATKPKVYPNPFNENGFRVKMPAKTQDKSLYQIQDALGRIVEEGRLESESNVGRSLDAGLYVLHIQNGTDTRTFKITRR